jgi:hypothetical protein
MVVVGSWCPSKASISLNLDWDALGLAPRTVASAPAIDGMQAAIEHVSLSNISIPPGKGIILVLQ